MSKKKTEGITEPQAKTLRVICEILDGTGLPPTVKDGAGKGCAVIEGRKEGRNIVARAEADGGTETRSRIKIEFCDPKTEKMPADIVSNEFVVVK